MNKLLFFPLLLTAISGYAQQGFDLLPGKPELYNGIEYGCEIRNERRSSIKDEPYTRYELTVYTTNKSGCTKVLFPKQTIFGEENQDLLASFDCINASGRRLTSKGTSLRAKPFTIPYKQITKAADGKNVTTVINVPAGHMLRNGETVSENIIVIVPEGEAPRIKVRIKEGLDL